MEIRFAKTLEPTFADEAGASNELALGSRLDELLARVAHISAVDRDLEQTRKNLGEDGSPYQAGLPLVGEVVDGRYRVAAKIGQGAMGAVFAAHNLRTGREVALKYMLSDARVARRERSASLERFVREAQAVGRVQDPHVVDIYDVGGDLEAPYLVMERLHGQSLRTRLLSGVLRETELLKVAKEATRGVAAAHRQGVVHRDLKPDNLFLALETSGDVVTKVLDFGVSRITDAAVSLATLTSQGVIIGTPAYMPPEQLRGDLEVDASADVYALGAIMYEALSGKRPYPGRLLHELIASISSGQAIPLATTAPHVSPWLRSVVMKCLAFEPRQRFADAGELLKALEAEQHVRAPQRPERRFGRPVVPWLAAVLASGAVGSAYWMARARPEAMSSPIRPEVSAPVAAFSAPETNKPEPIAAWTAQLASHEPPLSIAKPATRRAVTPVQAKRVPRRTRKLRRDEF